MLESDGSFLGLCNLPLVTRSRAGGILGIGSDAATSTFAVWMRDWPLKLNCVQQMLDDRSLFFLDLSNASLKAEAALILFYPSPFLGGGQMFFEKVIMVQTRARVVCLPYDRKFACCI
jgi:hypothetical protein